MPVLRSDDPVKSDRSISQAAEMAEDLIFDFAEYPEMVPGVAGRHGRHGKTTSIAMPISISGESPYSQNYTHPFSRDIIIP
ncbi:hypothetical protein VCV18_002948 [Metarhizium anisopliae]